MREHRIERTSAQAGDTHFRSGTGCSEDCKASLAGRRIHPVAAEPPRDPLAALRRRSPHPKGVLSAFNPLTRLPPRGIGRRLALRRSGAGGGAGARAGFRTVCALGPRGRRLDRLALHRARRRDRGLRGKGLRRTNGWCGTGGEQPNLAPEAVGDVLVLQGDVLRDEGLGFLRAVRVVFPSMQKSASSANCGALGGVQHAREGQRYVLARQRVVLEAAEHEVARGHDVLHATAHDGVQEGQS